MRNPVFVLAAFVVALIVYPVAFPQQAPAKPAAKCESVPQSDFNGILMCHDAAVELKNTSLEMDNAKLSYREVTSDYRAKMNELQQIQNAQVAKILKDNPNWHVEPNGTFAQNVAAAAPTKPEVKPAPAARK